MHVDKMFCVISTERVYSSACSSKVWKSGGGQTPTAA